MTTAISPGVSRRILVTLFVSQSLASAAFVANTTINPIAGAELSGQPGLAGVPGTLLLIGAACAAYPAGRFIQKAGWRPSLTLGFVAGLLGMLVSGLGVISHSFALFLLGLMLIGMARGVTDLSRYAAADANVPARRGRNISVIVWAGTIGAIAGPAIVAPLGDLVVRLNLDPLAGTMLGGLVLFSISAVLLALFLRPDPHAIARTLAAESAANSLVDVESTEKLATHPVILPARNVLKILRQPLTLAAVTSMIIGQAVMTLVMGVTSLHMHNHQHSLGDVSFVITMHVLGMYGLSPVTGLLMARIGRVPTILLGAVALILGSLFAPMSILTGWLAVTMFLVGLGWNLSYIGGSALLAESIAVSERSAVQGTSDLLVNLSAAVCSLGSGFILAALGYTVLCLVGAVLAVTPIVVSGWRSLKFTQRTGDVSLN